VSGVARRGVFFLVFKNFIKKRAVQYKYCIDLFLMKWDESAGVLSIVGSRQANFLLLPVSSGCFF
jgi:hypothetical protein